jgi:hypothetical protein
MKDVWGADLRSFLPACSLAGPRFESAPVTSGSGGQPYSYEPVVSGVPRVVFILLDGPPGLVVHAQTGRLYWGSAVTGSHNVEVLAINSEGGMTQSFTLTIN